jgi:hypothetical protein
MFNWVHRFWFYSHYIEDDGLGPNDGGKQSSEWFFSPQMLTQGGWYWEVDIYRQYDAPTSEFTLINVQVPPGQYTYNRRRLAFNSPQSEPFWFLVNISQGTFYGGTAQHPFVQANWNTPSGRLVLQAQQEWLFFHAPLGNGTTRLSTLTGTYSFTPDLYLSTQMQYDQDVLHGVSYNARLRWIVGGASNIYLVMNHGLVTETTGLGVPVVAAGNEIILKVQWDFRN